MKTSGESISGVLEKFEAYLRREQLAPKKVQPHLVRWTGDFLHFPDGDPGSGAKSRALQAGLLSRFWLQ